MRHKQMKYVRLVNMLLTIALAVAFLSGILLKVFQEEPIFQILHKISAVILLVGAMVHVGQHKKRGNKNEK